MTFLLLAASHGTSWYDIPVARSLGRVASRSMRQLRLDTAGGVGERVAAWVTRRDAGSDAASTPTGMIVGEARLRPQSNGHVAERRVGEDLARIGEALDSNGTEQLRRLIGTFAVAQWHDDDDIVVAARDALGEQPLFYRALDGGIAIANRAALLAPDLEIDETYAAQFLANDAMLSPRTIYRNVVALFGGTMLRYERGTLTVLSFWSADSFSPANRIGATEAIDGFRALFEEAVSAQISTTRPTIAQLSGGLDSSSVVSVAQHLAATGHSTRGVAATITMIDSLGDGDEQEFAQLVTARWGLRQHRLVDYWPWQDDGQYPLLCDEPYLHYPYFARERAICDILESQGSAVMLTGIGSDQSLGGNLGYILDYLVRGEVGRCARAVLELAIEQRRSMWYVGYREVIRPLMRRVQPWHRARGNQPRSWVRDDFAQRVGWAELTEQDAIRWRLGSRFADAIAPQINALSRRVGGGMSADAFDVRHAFLYRPLVEFCLTLPAEWRINALETKVVLRRALADVVPEPIVARSGKGGIGARIRWSLAHERRRLREILANSILADAGVIDAREVERNLNRLIHRGRGAYVHLLRALALETWLQVRAGTWVVRQSRPLEGNGRTKVDPQQSPILQRLS